jgi:glycosyltransferase involved in cell wall biosynthesis
MKPLVSILIPAYNADRWIAETIKSAIAQTWPRKEIIVVDDGSTDQTASIARQFASEDIAIISKANEGAAAARNHALAVSQGEYIQWLDADDLLSPDKIANQMELATKHQNPQMLFSSAWGSFAHRIKQAEFRPTALWQDLSPVEWLLRKLSGGLHMQTATWLVSRELAQAAGTWDTRMLSDDDGEYFCRVIMASDAIRFVPEAKVFYRVTPASRLSYIGYSDRKRDAMFLSMQLHVRYIRSLEDSDRVRAACLRYLSIWLINFYPERPDIVDGLQKLAQSLGGELEIPRLRWKYAWLAPLCGWRTAKQAQFTLPQIKASLLRGWDYAMHKLEARQQLTR